MKWDQERMLRERFPTARFEEDVQIKNPHLLTIGENVVIQKGTILHCGGMDWSDGKGSIQIGSDVGISPNCVLYGTGGIVIGDRSGLGPGCMVFSQSEDISASILHKRKHIFREVLIGKDVIIGAGCIVIPGVTVGDGAVIKAGSVITKDVPSMTVWSGLRAKPTGERK